MNSQLNMLNRNQPSKLSSLEFLFAIEGNPYAPNDTLWRRAG